MADFSYQPVREIKYTRIVCDYEAAKPSRMPLSRSKIVLVLLAIVGGCLAAVGLIAAVITPHAWAAGVFVIGMLLFSMAGWLARQLVGHRRMPQWHTIT